MPAVAQISVRFARLEEVRSNTLSLPSTTLSVSPLTITQYALYNREIGPNDQFGINTPTNINYVGGFLTAGNKINVKHDSDLQLRQNLDVESKLYVDTIHCRRKGNTPESYQANRTDPNRTLVFSPFETDLTNGASSNYIRINTTSSSKNISIFTQVGTSATAENSIILNSSGVARTMDLKTQTYNLTAVNINNFGAINNSSTVVTEGQTTINNNLRVRDNFSLGTTSFNRFNVVASSGNVSFTGSLDINSGKFTVNSANGNTNIDGTLFVNSNTTIKGTTTLSNFITFDTGNANSENRRIKGIRNLVNISEYTGTEYASDPLSVKDFTDKFYHIPKQITSNYTIVQADSQTTILVNNGSNNINITLAANLRQGTQVSFIRQGTGAVSLIAGAGVTLRSAPTNSFTKLAFQNSVATCYLGPSNTYYLFGDLLP
jgi:hypothetical protein